MVEEKKNIPKVRFREFAGDDANAWELRKLGNISKTKRGLTYKPSNIDNTGIRVLRSSNIKEDTFVISDDDVFVKESAVNIPFVENGDILITAANGSTNLVGKHAIIRDIPKNSAVHGGFMLITTSKEYEFLNALMSSNWYKKFIKKYVVGGNGAIGNLRKNDLDNQKIYVPKKDEQKKIGNFFKMLDSLITLHQRELDNYKMLKKTMLSKMFPKNDEKYPEIRFTGFAYAWEQRKLGEIVEWSKGSGLSKDALNIQGIGVPVIHYADLYKFNSVQKEVIHWTMNDIGTKIPENNLLFPMSDVTPDGLARTSTVLQSNVKAGGDVLIAKLNKDILSTFMSYQINRNKNQILPLVTGTTVRHINSKSLSTLKVTVPGKNEQKYVGSILMRFDSLIALHQRKRHD